MKNIVTDAIDASEDLQISPNLEKFKEVRDGDNSSNQQ
jgi:hypothetical protein